MKSMLAQSISIKDHCDFPNSISESSGICTINNGHSFWTINDSDGKPQLYEIDSNCNILRTVEVKNATNVDWEEICTDDQGNIFIGDFGNNSNNRKDLKIYKIYNIDLIQSDKVMADIINFQYSNQSEFPPSDAFKNFDMEAMIWLNNKIHLFSKNRTSPFSGYTYHYKVEDKAGDYKINPADSFITGPGPSILFWVTAAAISPDHNKLILLSHDRIWLFFPLNQEKFFESPVKQITLGHYSQKEGICFDSNTDLFISDEYNSTLNNGGKLYSSSLNTILNINHYTVKQSRAIIYVKEILNLEISPIDLLEIIDFQGRQFLKKEGLISNKLNLENLSRGLYYIILKSGSIIKRFPIFKE
ncbi:MAG: T9SS type A sorting domain-containing protein [Saprospiraceae bacterium]